MTLHCKFDILKMIHVTIKCAVNMLCKLWPDQLADMLTLYDTDYQETIRI